jgi:hypothetical protein
VISADFGWFCGFELFLLPAPGADRERFRDAQGRFSGDGQVRTRF